MLSNYRSEMLAYGLLKEGWLRVNEHLFDRYIVCRYMYIPLSDPLPTLSLIVPDSSAEYPVEVHAVAITAGKPAS